MMSSSEAMTLLVCACFLRLLEVQRRTGLSRSTIYNLINPKSKYYDLTFPKRINLTGVKGGAIGFLESDIEVWISKRALTAR